MILLCASSLLLFPSMAQVAANPSGGLTVCTVQVDTVQKGKNNITVKSPVASEILQETPCNTIPEEPLLCQKQIPGLTFPAREAFQTLGSICPFGLLHPTAHRPHPHTPGPTHRSLLLLYFNPSLHPVPVPLLSFLAPFSSSSKSLLPCTPVTELLMRMRSDPCPRSVQNRQSFLVHSRQGQGSEGEMELPAPATSLSSRKRLP